MLAMEARGQRQATAFVLALTPVVPLLSALGLVDDLEFPEVVLMGLGTLGLAALVRAMGRAKRKPMEDCLTDDGVDVARWRMLLRVQHRMAARATLGCLGVSALSLVGAALAGEPVFLLAAAAATLASVGFRLDVGKRAERHLAQLGEK